MLRKIYIQSDGKMNACAKNKAGEKTCTKRNINKKKKLVRARTSATAKYYAKYDQTTFHRIKFMKSNEFLRAL